MITKLISTNLKNLADSICTNQRLEEIILDPTMVFTGFRFTNPFLLSAMEMRLYDN